MEAQYEVAVVGLGAMGSATLYQLANRGVKIVSIDRLMTKDLVMATRITRQAVGEGAAYIPRW